MLRGRLGVLLVGVALAVVVASQASTGEGQGIAPSAPTTVAPILTPPTTVPGGTVAPGETTTTVPGPVFTAPPRGGATAGTTAKPGDEGWPYRRIGVTVGLIVIGLALLGFVYGRIRSTSPRPPLAPTAE
jgi:hypothetical protein